MNAGKLSKSSAILPTPKGKKTTAGKLAQRDAASAPGSQPHVIDRLLDCVGRMAVALELHFKKHPTDLGEKQIQQIEQIQVVMTKCHNILAENATDGGWKAIAALANQTRIGCEFLYDLSQQATLLDQVTAVAAHYPEWPVLLSRKKSSLAAAKEYIRRIGVGTKGSLPTASKISADNPWTQLASYLIDKIIGDRDFLTHIPDNPVWQEIFRRPENRPAAEQWKQVLDLPPLLNKMTRGKWWDVAKEMLKDYLDANPLESKVFFGKVKATAEDEAKSPRTIVIKSVREAFFAIAAKQ